MNAIVPERRSIIDRAKFLSQLRERVEDASAADLRPAVLDLLKITYTKGREEVWRRFEKDADGIGAAHAYCYLMDQVIRCLFDFTTTYVYPVTNPTRSERMSLVAVGGYGRGELAPYSDVDILFLLPYKQTPWGEQVVEYMLYMLWDLGLKVGHSTRSIDDCIRLAQGDLTIRTALLEKRFIWGDEELFDELDKRFDKEVIDGTGPDFVEAKLAERDSRHKKVGDSRYVVEPNLKEGKGGLRDLHTLYWIGKYLYRVKQVDDLVGAGVLNRTELRRFVDAEEFLWTVRCHLHQIAGRAEERLTFDVQPELARRLKYTDRESSIGVERFMKHYYLVAKTVGDLTRIFCAHMEEQHKRKPKIRLPRLGLKRREVDGFVVDGGWINVENEDDFGRDPVKMIKIFHVAQRHGFDIHPSALRLIQRNLRKINAKVRADPEANALFLDILTSKKNPELFLRKMNEAGVFGRFVPDFGRVVAQTQHDMYHTYTVDEHTIRAIGILAGIENGSLAKDHPLSGEIIHKVLSRRVLYVALMLHDIAKGRGGDHSILGAGVAEKLCPRLGMTEAETETTAWLVKYHLLMSSIAFKRDISDPKTVADFTSIVQSPERLRLLLILTVADIRAVGPGIWNGWKGQLLRDLYYAAEGVVDGGLSVAAPQGRIRAAIEDLRSRLWDWTPEEIDAHVERHFDSYWLSATPEKLEYNARLMRQADADKVKLTVDAKVDHFRAVTEITFYTLDHPGLFARITGALSMAGGSIVDAKIYTTKDGLALDTFVIQDAEGNAFADADRLQRVRSAIEKSLKGEVKPRQILADRHKPAKRERVFKVAPRVLIDNRASDSHTVIEVNGRDRPGLLADLAYALTKSNLSISSAHIATYGESAVDVFYVRNLFGHKITHGSKLKSIERELMGALDDPAAKDAA
jgi:[protein-PII] uridylyltransferase